MCQLLKVLTEKQGSSALGGILSLFFFSSSFLF